MGMIRIQGSLDKKNGLYVAVSGGVDSMALLTFWRHANKFPRMDRPSGQDAVYFDHGTEHGAKAREFVAEQCDLLNVRLTIGSITRDKRPDESREEFWRNERYKFFHSLDKEVVTAHHLNDCMETWIFTALHGNPQIIPYRNGNVIRPCRLTSKEDILDYARRHKVNWIEDPSNQDTGYMRNLIRHDLMPHALKVNPGLAKVIAKKVEREIKTT